MRLTIFGSSLVSSYWNGAATYYRGLIRALSARGHRITFCEPDAFDRQAHRDLETDPAYATVIVYRDPAQRDELLHDACATSDWVIKCSGVGVWDRELERGLAEQGGGEARTAFWDVDAPVTLARIAAHGTDPFLADLPRYDHVLTYGGGPPVVSAYLAAGARVCTPVYNGLDPREHRPEPGPDRFRYDVLFMGNRLPDREARVDEFFFAAAQVAPNARFALGGAGWEDRPLPHNMEYLGHVPTTEHNRVNSSAKLVLNIHRASMVENGWSPATRMFEAAGAAACQITDRWEGIADFLEPGREILVAEDGDDVARLVRDVDEATADRIGEAARRRALWHHSYARRARIVEQALEPAKIAAP